MTLRGTFNELLTPEERLEIQLRNEKIKRIEEYIGYQAKLNALKKRCAELEQELISAEKAKQMAGCSECDDLWRKIEYQNKMNDQRRRGQYHDSEKLMEEEMDTISSILERVVQKFNQGEGTE